MYREQVQVFDMFTTNRFTFKLIHVGMDFIEKSVPTHEAENFLFQSDFESINLKQTAR